MTIKQIEQDIYTGKVKGLKKYFYTAKMLFKISTSKQPIISNEDAVKWVKQFFQSSERTELVSLQDIADQLQTYIKDTKGKFLLTYQAVLFALVQLNYKVVYKDGAMPLFYVSQFDYDILFSINHIQYDETVTELIINNPSLLNDINEAKKGFIEHINDIQQSTPSIDFNLNDVSVFISWMGKNLMIKSQHGR